MKNIAVSHTHVNDANNEITNVIEKYWKKILNYILENI